MDLSEDDYFRNVFDYIASLSEDVKTPDGEYARRLALCRNCNNLMNGMCTICGCFVEVRAVKKNSHCAKSKEIW